MKIRHFVLALAAVAILGVAGYGLYWVGMNRGMKMADPAPGVTATAAAGAQQANASDPTTGKKVLYWHDPMVPGQKFDKPGKSPFMDMPLEPVYADEAGADAGVTVSSTAAQNLGIRVGKVEKKMLDVRVRAVGSVAFDERLLELVQPRVSGYVTRLAVKAPLERVHRGETLAVILAPEWSQAEQDYLGLLDANSERAQGLREAARQRLIVLGVPEATIKAVESTRTLADETTLAAPIDGVVTELGVREGAAFMAGTTLFRLNGLATVWVNAQIPESKLAAAQDTSTVTATATAWPGETFHGRVIALLPDVDPQTRTLTARVAMDNADRRLSPGMFVTVEFTPKATEAQLVVPTEAVITTGERDVVITRDANGRFHVVDVTLGPEQDGQTVVRSGLDEGQSIVLSGQFLIDSEANLKSTVNRLEAEPKP